MYGRDETDWNELVAEAVDFLAAQARLARLTTYTELNTVLTQRTGQQAFDFSRESDRAAMGGLLGAAVDQTLSDIGAMISSIVIYLNANDAGPGFYKLATELGLLSTKPTVLEKEAFWAGQVRKVHEHYSRRT
ncbi:MAG: hypothetical protein WA991_16425 [Ornithinimicrobium sp.]